MVAMYRTDCSRLAPWIEDAYDTLASEIHHQEGDHGYGLRIDRAREILHAEDRIEEDAQYAVKRLLDRGYLYTVDDELFITDPDSDLDR